MATLATINIGMNLGAQQGVHPFFEKNKRLAKYPSSSHQASSSREQPPISGDDGNLSEATTTTQALLPLQHASRNEVPNYPLTAPHNACQEVSGFCPVEQDGPKYLAGHRCASLLSRGAAQLMTPLEQAVQVNEAEVASLDVDPNFARNKRRRLSASKESDLTSVNHSAPWFVQLQEAAYGQTGPTTSPQSNLTKEYATAETGTPYLPPRGQVSDPNRAGEEGNTADVSPPEAGSLGMPSTQRSPPRQKMLKLKANGRLSSPKSSRAGSSGKDKKTSGNQKLADNHKVVVIRYGSDEESKNHIGQKIRIILSQEVKGQGLIKAPVDPLQIAEKVPSGPPKPTHPFFLGNAAPKQVRGAKALIESVRTSSSTAGSDSEHDLHVSPHRPRPPIENQRQAEPCSRSADPKTSIMSRGLTGTFRNPGGIEPAWPSKDAMHIRGLERTRDNTFIPLADRPKAQVKLKGSLVRVPNDEDVVLRLASQLPIGERRELLESSNAPDILRVPQRKVITGAQLQGLACRELSTKLHVSQRGMETDLERRVERTSKNAHPAVSRLFSDIPTSLTAFDRAQCEPYLWVHKYAPKGVEEVLQAGPEAILLRDWLRSLTIEVTHGARAEGQPVGELSTSAKRPGRDDSGPRTLKRRKRRKRAELLDGFVVSSDDESNELDELTGPEDRSEGLMRGSSYMDKRTVVRTRDIRESLGASSANAVLISGPHGCGKTAAVYAAAKELGFEVFELNPGSKRSGKDIMDKVGDMARNHLVHRSSEREERHEGGLPETNSTILQGTRVQGRPSTNSFNKMKDMAKTQAMATHEDLKPKSTPETKPKQSLILLEEVDILFDEDKQFWVTVLGLITKSKRPVIMTCNDESLVPLDQMFLHAILRFTQPACDPAADYLLLLAASEGHLLGRSAVLALYKSKDRDLRASITELEFWCQMAIGDKKGGLEWMLERWPAADDSGDRDQRLRVVSADTYLKGMGWFDRDNAYGQERSSKERDVDLLLEAWQNWSIGTDDLLRWEDTNVPPTEDEVANGDFAKASLSALKECERLTDAASATDLFGSPGLRTGYQALLDTTQPEISDKVRGSFVEGYTLIQSDPVVEHGDLSTVLAMNSQALASRTLSGSSNPMRDACGMEERFIDSIVHGQSSDHGSRGLTRKDLAAAFNPLAEPVKRSINQPTGLLLSEFDRSTSLLVEDLAPYVRSIIAYDLRLEQERLRLSNLLSQGGRDGKRIRTTRASRAALEGGSKAQTRRERWLPAGTNAALVLRTGGQGWQEVAAEYRSKGDDNGNGDDAGSIMKESRRSSLGSTSAGEV